MKKIGLLRDLEENGIIQLNSGVSSVQNHFEWFEIRVKLSLSGLEKQEDLKILVCLNHKESLCLKDTFQEKFGVS